jgi:hypothetical protein
MTFPALYFPRTTAAPPHPTLQIAYREGTPLPGPVSCPGAWSTALVVLTGRLFAQREVAFTVQVHASTHVPAEGWC